MEVTILSDQEAPVRKIYRSRKDRVIAGICGGVAEYFNIDPVWVRVGWVLSIFLKGLGLIAYVLSWILIPEREEAVSSGTESEAAGPEDAAAGGAAGGSSGVRGLMGSQPRVVIGVVLIVLGCLFALSTFFSIFDDRVFWALVCIVLGVALLAKR